MREAASARFTGPPLSSSQKTSENVITFVRSTTAALSSSSPSGRTTRNCQAAPALPSPGTRAIAYQAVVWPLPAG